VTGSGGAGMLPPSMLVSSSVRFPPLQKVKKTEAINYNSHGNQEVSTATIKKVRTRFKNSSLKFKRKTSSSGYRELGRRNNSKGNKTKMKKQKNTVVQKNTWSTKNNSKNTEVITNPRNILLPTSF
jgi:hypothetical protein